MTGRIFYVPAFDEAEARIIAESVARGETSTLAYHTDRAEVERMCAHLNRSRNVGARHQTFAVPVSDRVSHDARIKVAGFADRVGDALAMVAIFALIPLVGLASLWERLV